MPSKSIMSKSNGLNPNDSHGNSPMVRLDVLQRGEANVAAHCGFQAPPRRSGKSGVPSAMPPRGRAVKRRNTVTCAEQRVNLPNGGSQGGFHLAHIAAQNHHRVMDGMSSAVRPLSVARTREMETDHICKSHDDGRVMKRCTVTSMEATGRRIGKNLIRDTLGQTLDQVRHEGLR